MTTREQAEQVMREAQQLYRTMADALPVLVWQSGLDKLCIISINVGWSLPGAPGTGAGQRLG